MTQIEQKQAELINILKEQITQLSLMSKIELGDDVIFAIRDLQNEIENLLQSQLKHPINTLNARNTIITSVEDNTDTNTKGIE